MSAAKTERLLNLLIMLLVQRGYISKERIRSILYADASDQAFERAFERDKEELRSLGVPIEVGSFDPLFDDEQGYRIRPDSMALPEINLTPEEASVVALAGKVWDHARLADVTTEAMRKLAAAGVQTDSEGLELTTPRLGADEDAFGAFWEATVERVPLRFDYQRPGQPVGMRHLQPWGVVRHLGRWYAVGLDTDRGEERIFRLSRVLGEVVPDGRPGSFRVPPGTDLQAIAHRIAPEPQRIEATLLVRPGAGAAIRRHGEVLDREVPGPDGELWDRIRWSAPDWDIVEAAISLAEGVVLEEPADLRAEVVRRLQAVSR